MPTLKNFLSLALLFFLSHQSAAQGIGSPCTRYQNGETEVGPFKASYVEDVILAQRWATYYDRLRWVMMMEGGETKIKLDKPDKPTGQDKKRALIPISTKQIFDKYFSENYLENCRKCFPIGVGGRDFGVVPVDKAKHDEFRVKQNLKFGQWALDCANAAKALNEWNSKIERLKGEMQVYCANQASSDAAQPSSSASSTTNSSSNAGNSSSNTGSSASQNTVSYNQAVSQQRSNQSSRQSEYNAWKAQQDRETQQFARDFESRRQQAIQNRNYQQQQMNAALSRFQSTLNQIVDQREREEERRELARQERAFNKGFDDAKRPFEGYLSVNKKWGGRLSDWFGKYGYRLPYDLKSNVQRDLKKLRGGASEAQRKIDNLYKTRNNSLDEIEFGEAAFSGVGARMWGDFRRNYDIENITSQMSNLESYLYKNNTPANRLMIADYAKIGYDFQREFKKSDAVAYRYGKIILNNISGYPGSSGIQSLVSKIDAQRAEENKRQAVKRSLKRMPQLAKEGNRVALNQMIDSLIRYGDKTEVANALKGRYINDLVQYGGYYHAYIKLANWFGEEYVGADANKQSSYLYGLALYATGQKNSRYFKLESDAFFHYYRKSNQYPGEIAYRAAINPDPVDIKRAFDWMKSAEKKTPPQISWPHLAIAFMTENYKPVIVKDRPVAYHGIWASRRDEKYLEVVKVDKNSPAALNGVVKGDLVVRVNGLSMEGILKGQPFKAPLSFVGRAPTNSEGKRVSSMNIELKKKDGRVLLKSFPVLVTSKNVKSGFAGTEKLLRKENPVDFEYVKKSTTSRNYGSLPTPTDVDAKEVIVKDLTEIEQLKVRIKQINERNGVTEPRLTLALTPTTPAEALANDLKGEVHLFMTISDGQVTRCRPFITDESHRIFVDAATQAGMLSQFEKPENSGMAQRVLLTYTFPTSKTESSSSSTNTGKRDWKTFTTSMTTSSEVKGAVPEIRETRLATPEDIVFLKDFAERYNERLKVAEPIIEKSVTPITPISAKGLSGAVYLNVIIKNDQVIITRPYITDESHLVFVDAAVKAALATEFVKTGIDINARTILSYQFPTVTPSSTSTKINRSDAQIQETSMINQADVEQARSNVFEGNETMQAPQPSMTYEATAVMPRKARMTGQSGEVHLLIYLLKGEIYKIKPFITEESHRVFVESAVNAAMDSEFKKPEGINASQLMFHTIFFEN